MTRRLLRLSAVALVALLVVVTAGAPEAAAQGVPTLDGDVFDRSGDPEDVVTSLELLFLLTVLTLAPSILVMTTSFTRIVIVLSFLRRALSTQELPPNQIVIGLSLILTFLVMAGPLDRMRTTALEPYMDSEITQVEAFERAESVMRDFMFRHVRAKDLRLFLEMRAEGLPETRVDVPTTVLVPAFVLSELRKAFLMGFALFLPFVIIDLVVASTLISMGMLVLPPILISLPFKILLFVLVDGWYLVVGSVVDSFF